MTRRAAVLVAALLLMASACEIQHDASPRDVPPGERALLEPADPEAGRSEGASRVFLLASAEDEGERQLRSVSRQVESTPTALLEELFLGPNQQEFESGLRTALPDELTLHSARPIGGTLIVDLSPEILELGTSQLRLAVAAIVFTASQLPGVSAVRLRVDGETRTWPDGSGELQDMPLTVYDYPGLAESSQPPFPAVPSEPLT